MCVCFCAQLLCCRVRVSEGLAVVWIVLSLSSSFTARHRDPASRPSVLYLSLFSHIYLCVCSFSHRHQETNRRLKNVSGKIKAMFFVLFFFSFAKGFNAFACRFAIKKKNVKKKNTETNRLLYTSVCLQMFGSLEKDLEFNKIWYLQNSSCDVIWVGVLSGLKTTQWTVFLQHVLLLYLRLIAQSYITTYWQLQPCMCFHQRVQFF